MKWLIVLLLIVAAVALVAVRYRRQLQTGIYLWRMFRKIRQVGKAQEKQVESVGNYKDVPLVRCTRCGTWTPQTKAMKLGAKTFYCSANCMETAVKVA